MIRRPWFWLLLVFWLTMNALLWWHEYGGMEESQNTTPPGLIWEKILAAPDPSNLEIYHGRRKMGYCRWTPTVLETEKKAPESEEEMEGQIHRISGYTLEVEIHFFMDALTNRWRLSMRLEFDPERVWRELSLRVNQNAGIWEVKTKKTAEIVELRYDSRSIHWDQRFTYEELRNPEKILAEWGLPASILMPFPWAAATNQSLPGFSLKAGQGWFPMGHSRARAYRLEARGLDRYSLVAWISREGEILRCDLPDDWHGLNEMMSGWPMSSGL